MPLTSAHDADVPISVRLSRESDEKLCDEPSSYCTETASVTEVATLIGEAAAESPAGVRRLCGELAFMLTAAGMTRLTWPCPVPNV
jgi:hypothetical protein